MPPARVEVSRRELLPDPGLADDQDVRVVRAHLLRLVDHALHPVAPPDDLDAVLPLALRREQRLAALLHRARRDRLLDDGQERVVPDRLRRGTRLRAVHRELSGQLLHFTNNARDHRIIVRRIQHVGDQVRQFLGFQLLETARSHRG